MIPASACQPWHADHPGPCRTARLSAASYTTSRDTTSGTDGGADAFAADVLPIVNSLRAGGVTDLRGLANALNGRGVRTASRRTLACFQRAQSAAAVRPFYRREIQRIALGLRLAKLLAEKHGCAVRRRVRRAGRWEGRHTATMLAATFSTGHSMCAQAAWFGTLCEPDLRTSSDLSRSRNFHSRIYTCREPAP